MSKKSRRRNKKILGALGALGAIAMLGNRKPKQSSVSADSGRGSGLRPTVDDMEFKETVVSTPVSTKTTIMDSMPARTKLNQKSKRVTDKGEVYTIEGAKAGVPKKIGNTKTAFVGDNYIYRDGKPYTKGRFGSFAARNKKPAMLGDSGFSLKPSTQSMSGLADGDFAAKNGGRAKLRSGGKVKGCGIAKRGLGRAMKKGRK